MPLNANFQKAFLPPHSTISEALKNMLETGFKTVLVVDETHTLLGIVTDWDIRIAFLDGVTVSETVETIMNREPATAPAGLSSVEYQNIILRNGNDSLPIVNEARQVVDLIILRNMIEKHLMKNPMMIMAGGKGKRLWPLTKDTPKPLLPVGNRPILEHISTYAHDKGLNKVWVSTHYQADRIQTFVEEATPEGMEVNIIREENPLGTAGSLRALYAPDDLADAQPIFIMNGDILTTLDFQNMLDWHINNGNQMTLCCRQYVQTVPYGVLETEGQQVLRIKEKPGMSYNVNAGIYLVEPQLLSYIPEDVYFDMTDLIDLLLVNGIQVGTYPISESWIDIGMHSEYEKANINLEHYIEKGSR